LPKHVREIMKRIRKLDGKEITIVNVASILKEDNLWHTDDFIFGNSIEHSQGVVHFYSEENKERISILWANDFMDLVYYLVNFGFGLSKTFIVVKTGEKIATFIDNIEIE